MVRSVVLVCLGVLSVASAAAAQVPPPPPPPPGSTMTFGDGSQADAAPTVGTWAISGVVTDGTTGAPIAGALIQLVGGAGQSGARPRQMTDAKGRFIFTQLPAFRDYTLVASPVGYLDGGYRRPPGAPALVRRGLKDGEWFTSGNISMYRPPAISGVVRDERGEPLVDIPVRVLVSTRIGGQDRWAAGLLAGRYVVHVPSVQVTLPTGEPALYRRAPGPSGAATGTETVSNVIRSSDGTGMMVDGDGNVTNVVIELGTISNAVTGIVRDGAGRVVSDGAVLTFPANPAMWKQMGISAQQFRTSTIVTDGTYRVTQLIPGEYLLAAVPMEDRSKWVDPDFLTSIAA